MKSDIQGHKPTHQRKKLLPSLAERRQHLKELEDALEELHTAFDPVILKTGEIYTSGGPMRIVATRKGHYSVLIGRDTQSINAAAPAVPNGRNDLSGVYTAADLNKEGLRRLTDARLRTLSEEITEIQNQHMMSISTIAQPNIMYSSSATLIVLPDPANPGSYMIAKKSDALWNKNIVGLKVLNGSNYINPRMVIERGLATAAEAQEAMWRHRMNDGPGIIEGEDPQQRHLNGDMKSYAQLFATRAAQHGVATIVSIAGATRRGVMSLGTPIGLVKISASLALAVLSHGLTLVRHLAEFAFSEGNKILLENSIHASIEKSMEAGEGHEGAHIKSSHALPAGPFRRTLRRPRPKDFVDARGLVGDELVIVAPKLLTGKACVHDRLIDLKDLEDGYTRNTGILVALQSPLDARHMIRRDEHRFIIRSCTGIHRIVNLEEKREIFHYVAGSDLEGKTDMLPELRELLRDGGSVIDVYNNNDVEGATIHMHSLADGDVQAFIRRTVGEEHFNNAYAHFMRADPVKIPVAAKPPMREGHYKREPA